MRRRAARSPRPTAEQGQVAIVVAAALVALLGLTAIVVDLGLAYSTNARLQSAADAAAQAAASTYATIRGPCDFMVLGGGPQDLERRARANGREMMTFNEPGSSEPELLDFAPKCSEGTLLAEWWATDSSAVGLGSSIVGDELSLDQTAVARLSVAAGVDGDLLPFGICSESVPAPEDRTSQVVRIPFDADDLNCPSEESPGRFWGLHCPGQAVDEADFSMAIGQGCERPVHVVSDQPATDLDAGSPDLREHLIDEGCQGSSSPNRRSDCLLSISAELDDADEWRAWQGRLADQVFFPVFCGGDTCGEAATVDDGSVSRHPRLLYPVLGITAVTLCGYDWGDGDAERRDFSVSGRCGEWSSPSDQPTDGDGEENYIAVVFEHVPVTHDLGASSCPLGSACDLGPRVVRLVE